MQSSGHKRRETAGFAYPAIPARDQDIPPYGAANKPTSFRTVHVSYTGDSSPADVFRAESVTHINKENEQFVRTYHPSLSSQEDVCVSESVFGEPVWLVLSPLAASQSVYAGGRPIHYFPGYYTVDTSYGPFGPLTPRSPEKYNQHFDRYINPRRFLTPADLDSLRELFPEAVSIYLLIAGFLIILFEEERHVQDTCNKAWPLELAGLQVFFHLTPSRFDKGLRVFEMMVDQIKQKMRRFLSFIIGEHDRALVVSPPSYPLVIGWASYSEALDRQDCYVVAQNTSTGGIREVRGIINSNLFLRAAVLGTGYSWDKIRKQTNAFLLWHTEHSLAPVEGTSGALLCLGHPSDTVARVVVFQNFEQSYILAHMVGKRNKKQYALVKGGFILAQEIRDSTILSGETPTSTAMFNALTAGNRASTEHEYQ
ncbi:hypothetical protein N7445_006375 [Penicillium cf. griseofulvum]|nr:hypothetical protein N7445_006375 [Penicillium cf. griseofulvum]